MNIEKNRTWVSYMACLLLSIISTILAFELWELDVKVPIGYRFDGDYKSTLLTINRACDLSNFFATEQLGAPFVASNYDYPFFGDVLNILYFRLFVEIAGDLAVGINVGFLFLVPLTAMISMYAMKQIGVSDFWSILGGITFAIIPYRFLRSLGHLFLNCYWQVPLAVLLVVWLFRDERFFEPCKKFFSYKRNIIGVISCIIIAYTGVYYAFFTVFFICVMMLVDILKNKKIKRMVKYIHACVLICLCLLAGSIPYTIFEKIYGKNPLTPIRNAVDAEIYGMKITRLILPLKDHGISYMQKIREQYASAPLPNEGTEYLGIVGILGLIILLLYIFKEKKDGFGELCYLNLAAILLATIGGIGSLFALFVSPQIRGYNRISVFIAFFTITAVGLLMSQIVEKTKKKYLVLSIGTIIYVISCIEQASIWDGQYEADKASFLSDQKIVNEIEQRVSDNAMIYQWVYQPYPEVPPIYNMGDYSSARGYLHSDSLRWSYGDQKGRESDLWNSIVASYSTSERVAIISNVGFEGIWIDSNAYTEEELNSLCSELEKELDVAPIVSDDGRMMFFDMKIYNEKYKAQFSQSDWEAMKEKNLKLHQ